MTIGTYIDSLVSYAMNIGLIGVMGLAVLPSRLKTKLADLAQAVVDGKVFAGVLEDAGVYKNTPAGKEAFLRFVQRVNQEVLS